MQFKPNRSLLGKAAALFLLCLIFVGLRWNNYDAPLIRDEGEYAYSAWLLKQGHTPYQEAFLQKPPMIIYTYVLADWINPAYWTPRILAAIFLAGTTVLTGLIARKEFGSRTAFPAMFILTPMLMLPYLEEFFANTEMFLLLPLMGMIAVYVFDEGRSLARNWLLAGILSAVVILYKYTVLPMLLFVFAVWTVENWRKERNLRKLLRNWAMALSGGSIVFAAALYPFFSKGALGSLWECVVAFNREYSDTFDIEGLIFRLSGFFSLWWILFLLPCVFFFKRPRRFWFWGTLFGLSWIVSFASYSGHYYLPIMPFWALLAALALDISVSLFRKKFPASPRNLNFFFGLAVSLILCLESHRAIRLSRMEFQQLVPGPNPFWECLDISEKIKSITGSNDRIFVAGSEPQILYYTKRLSSSRFVIVYPLMLLTSFAERYQQTAIEELKRNPPAVIVFSRPNTSWLQQPGSPVEFPNFISELTSSDYDLIGGYVRSEGKIFWQDDLTPKDIEMCSLLLYKRK